MAIISANFPATVEFSASTFNNILKKNRRGLILTKFFWFIWRLFLQEEEVDRPQFLIGKQLDEVQLS